MFTSKSQKNIAIALFGCYLTILTLGILFKFGNVSHMRKINVIPYWIDCIKWGIFEGWQAREIGYNILAFVPLGIYAAIFRFRFFYFIPFGVSLFYETVQYIFAIGVTDTTDLIGNTFGGFIGIGIWYVLHKRFSKNAIRIVNGIGIGCVVLECVLLFLIKHFNIIGKCWY